MPAGNRIGELYLTLRLDDQLSKQLGVATNQIGKVGRDIGKNMNLAGTQKQMQGFSNQLITQFLDIKTIASQVVHYITFSFGVQMVRLIEGAISGLISSVKDFDKAITNTATVSGYAGAAFDAAREKIAALAIEIGKNTIYSAVQAADALYTLAQAGYDVTKITKDELIPILNYAAATNISLSDAMQDVITVMKQFKLTFEDTTVIVDTFTAVVNGTFASAESLRDAFRYTGQIAGALGQNFQDLAATIGIMADRGYDGCYDKETRVLTNEGFKYFKDLNGKEKFLTYNLKTGKLEWQTKTKYFEYDVNKKLYRVKNKYIDLFVTDNHNMVVSGRFDKKFRIEKAKDVYGKTRRYKLYGDWDGKDPEYFILPESGYTDGRNRIKPETKIPFKLWIRFMALFLSEGWTTYCGDGNYKVGISQKINGKAYNEIIDCLNKMPYKYNISAKGDFSICSKQLYSYLKQFGHAEDKHIPDNIKNASKETLSEFIKYYELGDGCGRQLYTSSTRMRDDLVEIIMKTGRGTSFFKAMEVGERHFAKGRGWIEAKHDNWCIGINTQHATPLFSRKEYTEWHRKDRYKDSFGKTIIEDWVLYEGKVYCVEVPNSTLVVERNGKVVICGNSTAGQRLNQIFTQLLRPTEQGKKALDALGLSVADLNPYSNSLVEVLYKLRDAQFSATDAATLFRARTAGAIITLVNEVDSITALRREVALSAGITQSFADKQMTTMDASMKRLQNSTEAASLSLRGSLVPVINFLANTLRGFTQGIEGVASAFTILVNIMKPFKPVIQGLLSILLAIGPVLLIVAVGAKLLAYTLPMIGAGAVVSAAGVQSLSIAMKSLFSYLFLIMIPLQTISMIFPQLSNSMSILTTALLVLIVAWKFHLIAVLASSAGLIAHNLVAGYYSLKLMLITGLLYLQIAAYAIWNALVGIATGVMTALTVATGSFAVALALATAGISLLLAGIAWLVANFGTVSDAVSGFVGGITDAIGVTKKQAVLTEDETKKLIELESAVTDVTKAEQDRLTAQKEINRMMEEGITDTEAYTAAIGKLDQANADYNTKSTKVLEISAELISSIRGYSENLDTAISKTGEYNKLVREKGTLEGNNARLAKSQSTLLDDYNQAILEEGINSDKAAQIYEQYVQISGQKGDNDRRLLELTTDINAALSGKDGLTDSTNKLNEEEKARLKIVNQIISVQEELLVTYDKIAEIQARISRLESIDKNLLKLLAEQTKTLWEQKLKLLDAEEKLAKLRASEPKLLDDIFNALAEQGLLTQDIIDLYIALQEAQGNLMVSRIEYFDVINTLSADEQKLVNDAIAKYEELRKSGVSAGDAFQQAFGGLQALIPSLDLGELTKIGNYAEDMWKVADATANLGDKFDSLMGTLKDLGLEDLITAIYAWLGLQPEIEKAMDDVTDAMYDYNQAFSDAASIIASEWLVVGQKAADGSWDVVASFKGLIGIMPSLASTLKTFNGNAETMVGQLLSSVNGANLSADSLDGYSASQLIAVASLIEMYKQQGFNLTSTTTLDDIVKDLGLDSETAFGMLQSGAEDVVSPLGTAEDSLGELVKKLGDKDTPDSLIGGLSGVIDKLDLLIAELNKPPPKTWFDGVLDYLGDIGESFGNWLGGGGWQPNPNLPPTTGPWKAKGGIVKAQKGMIMKGPQTVLAGEAGDEAFIPLEGANKKYGEKLLKYIIPTYYPDLLKMQQGGVIGSNYDYSSNPSENYTVTGPIYVQGVADAADFAEKLKFKMRASI